MPVIAAIAVVIALAIQAAPLRPPVPEPAIASIIKAFHTHDLVAISDPHGNAGMRDFLRRLVAEPRFIEAVDDLVLEIGNARYQSLVDDYVNAGSADEYALAEAWLNTTVANQISADIELFRLARKINAGRSAGRRLRLLMADPPIDWSTVKTRDDHLVWLAQRDSFPAALVQTEVIAKRRKALIVYGHLHFQRRNVASNFEMADWRMQTIVSLIERSGPARVFTIWRLDEPLVELVPDAANWPLPAIAAVAGTSLGAADAGRLSPNWPRIEVVDGKPRPLPKERYATLPIEQQLDAVLYLGASQKQMIQPSADVCKRPGFLEERLRRIAVTGIPKFEADTVQKLCADAAQSGTSWRDPSPHQVRFVAVEPSVRLEVLDWGGTGRPILFVGCYLTGHVYDNIAPKLTDQFRVYAVTRRGVGASDHPVTGYDPQRRADDILAVIDAAGMQKPILIGNSCGGGILHTLGAQYPDRLGGLVYLDAAEDPTLAVADYGFAPADLEQMLERMPARAGQSVPVTFPESERRQMAERPLDPAIRKAIVDDNRVRPDYARIRVPVLAIYRTETMEQTLKDYPPGNEEQRAAVNQVYAGKRARLSKWQRDLLGGVPTARIVELADANLFMFLSNEADVLREVRAFAATLQY